MGKGKLAKFADMRDYPHVFEYPYSVVDDVPFEMKGNWNRDFFKNDHPPPNKDIRTHADNPAYLQTSLIFLFP